MVWRAPVVGVAIVLLGMSVARVDARTVRYEINGQHFSYSTKSRAQVEMARQRIDAANAAAAARAKANAELAANPLVRVFGSQSENDAKAAEANLTGVLASTQSPPERSQVRKMSVAATGRLNSRQATHATQHIPPETRDAATRTRTSRNATIGEPVRHAGRAEITTGSVQKDPAKPPRPRPDQPTSSPKIQTIVFDFASGIRTAFNADGTVEEAPFERDTAEQLKRAKRPGGPEIKFVNEGSKVDASTTE